MKTQLGDVWILGMPFFRLLARRHRQMGGGFHFVNSWDVYPLSSSTSCTIRASLIVFWQVKQVLKMRLFFFKCFSNVCWMCTPSLITIFPSLPKATTTPLSTVRGRSCNLQKQARIANPSPCMRARMVPGIFFFSKDTASLNKISSSKFFGWWQLEHFFIFTPIRFVGKMMNPIGRSHIIFRWVGKFNHQDPPTSGFFFKHPILGWGIFGWLSVVGRWPLSGENLFFVASEASAAAYRPLDVDLAKVLPPRFALQYGCLVVRDRIGSFFPSHKKSPLKHWEGFVKRGRWICFWGLFYCVGMCVDFWLVSGFTA